MAKDVLVLGDDNCAALAVVRSLGRAGLRVQLGTMDRFSVCRYSRYVYKTYLLPSPQDDDWWFINALISLLRERSYSLVIPVSDPYLVPIMKYQDLLADLALLAVPSGLRFSATYDKSETIRLAEACKVPHPKTRVIQSVSEVDSFLAKASYPVVVKARSSKFWYDGQELAFRTRFVYNEGKLRSTVERIVDIVPVLLQEAVEGVGVGQEFLTQEGRILAAFQHERLYEPSRGPGGSYYRRSTKMDSELLLYSSRMIRKLGWTGVLMIEYKCDKKSGRKNLMEINGRFWGSLPLAITSGVDFPWLLYSLLVESRTSRPPSYRTDMFCRNLKDFYRVVRRYRTGIGSKPDTSTEWSQISDGIRNMFQGREFIDGFLGNDPTPGIMDFLVIGAPYMIRLLKRVRRQLYRLRYPGVFSSNDTMRKSIIELIRQEPRVLILCLGNVIRSPFAGAVLRNFLGENDVRGIQIATAGVATRGGKRPHPYAQLAAAKERLSIESHRSASLTKELVDWSGVILVMDLSNYVAVRRSYGSAVDKMCFLGVFSRGESAEVEIPDPQGLDREVFSDVFSQIKDCCVGLTFLLNNAAKDES